MQLCTLAKYMCPSSKMMQIEISGPVTSREVRVDLSSLELKLEVPLDWIPVPSVPLGVFLWLRV